MARQELAVFLRDRRQGLRPVDVGLPAGPRRRTPGLRREEVAGLAAMSVEYYARLEQARGPHPSPRILDALAGALRLTPAERAHLFRLAGREPRCRRPARCARSGRTWPGCCGGCPTRPRWSPTPATTSSRQPAGPGPAGRAQRGAQPGPPPVPGPQLAGDLGRRGVRAHRGGAAARRRRPLPARRAAGRPAGRAARGQRGVRRIWDTNPVRAPGHRVKTFDHPEVGACGSTATCWSSPRTTSRWCSSPPTPAPRRPGPCATCPAPADRGDGPAGRQPGLSTPPPLITARSTVTAGSRGANSKKRQRSYTSHIGADRSDVGVMTPAIRTAVERGARGAGGARDQLARQRLRAQI